MALLTQYAPEDFLSECRAWDAAHAAPHLARARAHANDRDPERRLRVGYVSPDFRGHTVAYFIEPLLAHHDHRAVEIFCYAEIANPDQMTVRFRRHADHWRPTVGLNDAALAERVREDGIDILVDLAGHTANNRLLAFAERPAPVQVSHLVGYGQTTGMSAMDYVLTDRWVTPAGCEGHYSETPQRLDRCFLSFAPRPDWPDITPLPASVRGHVTFASFNSPSRITPEVMAAWSRVLDAVPGSRLLLKNGYFKDAGVRAGFAAAFAAHGVGERVEIRGLEGDWSEAMDVYEEVDIALDTFPMNGGSTTTIALWMGLPVITLVGETALHRHGLSILAAMGREADAASDLAGYVGRAAALAGDPGRLAETRAGLRRRMAASPLLDHAGLAGAVEDAYRAMWRRWCGGGINPS